MENSAYALSDYKDTYIWCDILMSTWISSQSMLLISRISQAMKNDPSCKLQGDLYHHLQWTAYVMLAGWGVR